MANGNTSQQAQFERALAALEMAVKSGRIADPVIQDLLQRGLSPLGNGAHAAKAQAFLANLLTGPAILAGLRKPAESPEPEYDPQEMIFVGFRRALRRMTGILRRFFTSHFLIQGPTNSGKTNLIWNIIRQLIESKLKVVFHDHKNEGRKLLRSYSGVVVLNVSDFRENFLKPVGDPKNYFTTFWSEFARAYRIRRETCVKLIGLSLRVVAGLRAGEPSPSLYDFACMLHKLADSERDASLATAAGALEGLNATLGDAARVREGPCADDLFNVVVVQCHGLPAEFLQFFMGIRLLRAHLKAISRGHTGELTNVIVCDEGGIEFGKEFTAETGAGYFTPQKRMITQLRSSGTGLIIAAQDISAIDNAVIANVGSFMCLRVQSDTTARISARLLGLPEERINEVRDIPRWAGLFRSPSHTGPVLVDIPECNMGDYMSDADFAVLNRPGLERLNSQAVLAPIHEAAGGPISYRDVLGETTAKATEDDAAQKDFDIRAEYIAFVREILLHPDASVVEHYVNLGWSAGRGTRIKTELMESKILEAQRQTSRNGRPIERLVLTAKGHGHFDEHIQS